MKIIALLLLILSAISTHAIVNIEGIRNKKENSAFVIKGSFDSKKGNTEKDTVSGELQYLKRLENSEWIFLLKTYQYKNNDVLQEKQIFGHLRASSPINEFLHIEGYVQHESNLATKLSHRNLIGTGIRATTTPAPLQYLNFGAGVFYSTEELKDQTVSNSTEKLWRGNVYLALAMPVAENIKIKNITYYQPTLDNSKDYRILSESEAVFDVNKFTALNISYKYKHDSRPADSTKQYDSTLSTGLTFKF